MGGDGGSIPKRGDVVKTKGYGFKRNLGGMGYVPNTQVRIHDGSMTAQQINTDNWTTCRISQEPLKPPLLVCRLGQLYNKEALLEYMLKRKMKRSGDERTESAPQVKHLRSIKHDTRVISNLSFNSDSGRLKCPITTVEFEGNNMKGFFNWNCGCIASSNAIHNIKLESNECVCCGSPYKTDDLIPINPDTNQLANLRHTASLHYAAHATNNGSSSSKRGSSKTDTFGCKSSGKSSSCSSNSNSGARAFPLSQRDRLHLCDSDDNNKTKLTFDSSSDTHTIGGTTGHVPRIINSKRITAGVGSPGSSSTRGNGGSRSGDSSAANNKSEVDYRQPKRLRLDDFVYEADFDRK